MHKLAFLAASVAGAAVLAFAPALAQQATDYSKVELKSTDLGHGLTALAGVGGNITVAVGTDGIIMVDTEFAPLHDKIKAAVAALSPLPIKYIINTHYHGDHTGGNEAFAKDGAIVVAHENIGKRLANPPAGANALPPTPAPKGQMPVQNYSGQGTEVKVAGQTAELIHIENAHTDGDTIVFFPAADVIATGDIVGTEAYPNIDIAAGGTIDGMIAGADFVVDHSDAKTKIVPGHGAVGGKNDIVAYRNMLVTARTRIAKAKAKGMTEQQVVDAHLLTDLDKKWLVPGNALAARFPVNVYRSLK